MKESCRLALSSIDMIWKKRKDLGIEKAMEMMEDYVEGILSEGRYKEM